MAVNTYNLRKFVQGYLDDSRIPIQAGSIRALLDEIDCLNRKLERLGSLEKVAKLTGEMIKYCYDGRDELPDGNMVKELFYRLEALGYRFEGEWR